MLFAVSQMAKKRKIPKRTNRYENVLKILDSGSRELSQLARNEDAFLSTRLLLDNLKIDAVAASVAPRWDNHSHLITAQF